MRTYLASVGGLGNQLFTWNAAHYLIGLGKKVTIFTPKESTRELALLELREYCDHGIKLRESNLVFRILQMVDLSIWKFPKSKVLYSKLGLISYGKSGEHIRANDKKTLAHWGYFQNVEMVESQKLIVLPEILNLCQEKIKSIRNRFKIPEEYEAFHIRRGDLKENQQTIGVLSDDYYRNLKRDSALVITTEEASDLTNNFEACFISSNENSSNWESFAILCHSFRLISANSTFSWWAGMVARYRDPESEVIQPDRYYKNSEDQDFLKVMDFTQVRATYL